MYPGRGIVRTYRLSDGLSTRLYGPNTLTLQLAATNDASRDPPYWPCYWEGGGRRCETTEDGVKIALSRI